MDTLNQDPVMSDETPRIVYTQSTSSQTVPLSIAVILASLAVVTGALVVPTCMFISKKSAPENETSTDKHQVPYYLVEPPITKRPPTAVEKRLRQMEKYYLKGAKEFAKKYLGKSMATPGSETGCEDQTHEEDGDQSAESQSDLQSKSGASEEVESNSPKGPDNKPQPAATSMTPDGDDIAEGEEDEEEEEETKSNTSSKHDASSTGSNKQGSEKSSGSAHQQETEHVQSDPANENLEIKTTQEQPTQMDPPEASKQEAQARSEAERDQTGDDSSEAGDFQLTDDPSHKDQLTLKVEGDNNDSSAA